MSREYGSAVDIARHGRAKHCQVSLPQLGVQLIGRTRPLRGEEQLIVHERQRGIGRQRREIHRDTKGQHYLLDRVHVGHQIEVARKIKLHHHGVTSLGPQAQRVTELNLINACCHTPIRAPEQSGADGVESGRKQNLRPRLAIAQRAEPIPKLGHSCGQCR